MVYFFTIAEFFYYYQNNINGIVLSLFMCTYFLFLYLGHVYLKISFRAAKLHKNWSELNYSFSRISESFLFNVCPSTKTDPLLDTIRLLMLYVGTRTYPELKIFPYIIFCSATFRNVKTLTCIQFEYICILPFCEMVCKISHIELLILSKLNKIPCFSIYYVNELVLFPSLLVLIS
jgi:hypothetical protein